MAAITWDPVDDRTYETGVDHGVLYVYDPTTKAYGKGVAWNGLTGVTESPSGAEASAQYADNIKYLSLLSAEEFSGTIEAFTYPDAFAVCDGTAEPATGAARQGCGGFAPTHPGHFLAARRRMPRETARWS